MKDDTFDLFMVYNTITEQYYGPDRSANAQNNKFWVWRDNVDDIIPWLTVELEFLCKISDGHEKIGDIDINNIIIVSMNLHVLDFTDSIPLTLWQRCDQP